MQNHLPTGPQAYQQRYIEAFRGLTKILTAGAVEWGDGDYRANAALWKEMFEQLVSTEEHTPAHAHEEGGPDATD